MAKRNLASRIIENAKKEIEWQERLIAAVRATQEAQQHMGKRTGRKLKSVEAKPPDAA